MYLILSSSKRNSALNLSNSGCNTGPLGISRVVGDRRFWRPTSRWGLLNDDGCD
jgi:hypothetical protein